MAPKRNRVTKLASQGRKKAPTRPSGRARRKVPVSSSAPIDARSPPETTGGEPSSPVRKKVRRLGDASSSIREQPRESHPPLGSEPLSVMVSREAVDKCEPPSHTPPMKRSSVANTCLQSQPLRRNYEDDDVEDMIGRGNMLPETYADSQLLNLCLTMVRESSPFVGFQDPTPLGGTVWDSLHEFENVLAGEGWEDPVNFLVSKDMDELKWAKQDIATPNPTAQEELWDQPEKSGMPKGLT